MATKITQGIKISAQPTFEPNYSNKNRQLFVFSYSIVIENQSDKSVQLLSRKWKIFDSCGEQKIVEGEGVIGEKPILKPGEKFEYSSWCPLQTDMGSMRGSYVMLSLEDNSQFKVQIPEFHLVATYRYN